MRPAYRHQTEAVEIGIISRDGWTKQTTLTPDGQKAVSVLRDRIRDGADGQAISELAWSPNGRYLVSAAGPQILVWSMETRQVVARWVDVRRARAWLTTHRHSSTEGNITGLSFSPTANLIAFTTMDGSFSRWTDPVPSSLPSPITSEAVSAKKLDKLLDDEFGDEDDLDLEDRGEDLADDWIVDDDGTYLAEDDGYKGKAGRTEVGE